MKTTPEQRAEMRARSDAATEGPWLQSCGDTQSADPNVSDTIYIDAIGYRVGVDDAAFIATAREDVPALLDDFKELEAQQGSWANTVRRTAEERDAAMVRVAELEAQRAELRKVIGAMVETYDAWGAAEDTQWHDGAMGERIAACNAWQAAVDDARALLDAQDTTPETKP